MIDEVAARLEAKRDEIVALTQALVRIPTVNPPGDAYRPCAELIGERLRRRGFAVSYIRAEGTPGDSERLPRVNVVARRAGAVPGPCVHFNGHFDVVPAGQGWSMDPWAGEVRDGRIHGRGTCDQQHVARIGHLHDCVAYGPGILDLAHQPDEFVAINDLVTSAKVMALAALQLLGVTR